jgi:LPXTG-motif cell wall-anchored protein
MLFSGKLTVADIAVETGADLASLDQPCLERTPMSLRRATVVALMGLLAILGLAGTASAQYPPSTGTGTVSRSTVESGGTVEFCGDGFEPGSEVIIEDNGTEVGTATADGDGEFCITLTLTGAGTHLLTGTGTGAAGEVRVVSATVTVVAAGGLPRTGSDTILPAVGIGVLLAALGTVLVLAVRRRRQGGLVS